MDKNILIKSIGILVIIIIIFGVLKTYCPANDINWVAPLVGSIITAITTFVAVYLTAKQDRDARAFEYKYYHYIASLRAFEKLIPSINITLGKFKNMNFIFNEQNSNNDFYCAKEFHHIFEHLCKISKNFKSKTQKYANNIKNFVEINNLVLEKIFETDATLTDKEYTVQQIFDFAKSKCINFNINEFEENLKEIKELIISEYSMDDK